MTGTTMAPERGEILYRLDRQSQLRFSHENPSIKQCYADFLGQPLSERAHHLLHTDHHAWKMPDENCDVLKIKNKAVLCKDNKKTAKKSKKISCFIPFSAGKIAV